MIKQPIYLDYAATTPVDPEVIQVMNECLGEEGFFGNPASKHFYGKAASEIVEKAREQVAKTISADTSEIIFTSGATESINLALKGAAFMQQRKGKHIVTVKTEHKATLDACQQLEKEGFQVTYLDVDENGLIALDQLENHLRNDTMLVSVMCVNNETGVMQDLVAIGNMTKAKNILFHVDAAQAIGKIPFDVNAIHADLVSLSAHKVYGPKGIGALYLRKKPRVRVQPFIHGGGHEQGMRSGTLATHQIAGMGRAFSLAQSHYLEDFRHATACRALFLETLTAIPNMKLNVVTQYCVPHIINIRFENMMADAILADLPMIATSTASACQGKGTEGSYVLRAMGLTANQVKASIRFSFGRMLTLDTVQDAANLLKHYFE